MAQYTYLFVNLATQTVIGAISDEIMRGASFNRPLNAPGAFQGGIPLGDPKVGMVDPIGITSPGKVAVYVDRDGVLIWSGPVWSRSYDSAQRLLTVNAAEYESYFARRLITATYSPANVDQCTIAQSLITTAQAVTGGNVGVIIASQTSGVLRSFTWNGYELKTVQTAVKDMGQQAGGFDWSFDPAYIAGAPRTTFNTFYPARGTANAVNGLLFELPGNVVSYTLPEDGSAIDVTSYMTGSGSGASQIQTSATSGTLLGFGYPLLESASSDSSIVDLTTLGNAASARQSAANNPVSLLTLVVRADQDPVLGSYGPGDEIRVRITDARWPASVTPSVTTFTALTTQTDSSSGAHNGTLVGSVLPTSVASPWSGFGQALVFDGVGRGANTSGVDLGTSTALCVSGVGAAATFCTEAKVRTASSGASGVIVERANTTGGGGTLQPGIGGGVGATFFVQTRDNGGTYRVVNGTTTALANTNYEVAGAYDGTTLRLYVNGTMENSLALSGVEAPTAGIHTYIGRIDDATNPNPFSGTVDEVRISNVARYTAASYTPSATPFTTDANTLGLWHLDDATSTTTGGAPAGAGLEMLARITDMKITPPDGSTAESVTITANVSPALPGVPFVVRTGVT